MNLERITSFCKRSSASKHYLNRTCPYLASIVRAHTSNAIRLKAFAADNSGFHAFFHTPDRFNAGAIERADQCQTCINAIVAVGAIHYVSHRNARNV